MKASILIAVLMGCVLLAGAAEPFVTPDFVRELDEIEAVRLEAASDNKAISFLLMEPGST